MSGMSLHFDSSDEEDAVKRRDDGITDCCPLQIDWLKLPSCVMCSASVAIGPLPGCYFRATHRNLSKDLDYLREACIKEVVVLCTRGELIKYRTPTLLSAYEAAGFTTHHWPILDGSIPAMGNLLHLLNDIQLAFHSGKNLLIHCFGGLGRACLVAACLLLQLDDNLDPEPAIAQLRSLKGPGAIQTVKQYNFICEFRQLRDDYLQQSREETAQHS